MKEGFEIHGFALNDPEGFVVTNSRGIWLWDALDRVELIVGEIDGVSCSTNDCIADPAGRFFAGCHYYDPSKEYPLGYLLRVDPDGRARIVDEGIHLANGLGFLRTAGRSISPTVRKDASTPTITMPPAAKSEIGVSWFKCLWKRDSLTVDAEGFLWSAQWYGNCVVRYDPDGTVERRVPVPAKQTSSLIFGGTDLTDVFITSAARPEVLPIMPPGYDPHSGYIGGKLYHVNLGITGKPEFRARMPGRLY